MLTNQQKQTVIENYVQAYNTFDVAGMLHDLHADIVFKNIVNEEVNLELTGIQAFEEQAKQATAFFKERTQTITQIQFEDEQVTVNIAYKGVLAQDLPNGLKAGQTLELTGKSIFRFDERKIVEIQDIS